MTDREEMRKMLKKLGWLAAVILAASLIISAVERKEASPAVGVTIEIEPLEGEHLLIKEQDILRTINRSFGFRLEGLPLGAVDIERLEKVLEEDPFILDANVYLDARNRVHISVEQREPVLRIIDNNGLNYYLDGSGLKMPLSRHYTARVLVATGNIPPHVPGFMERKKSTLKDLFLLAQDIRADAFLEALFEQVYVTVSGEFVLVPKVGDQKVVFGRYENAPAKFRNLKIFYNEALPYEGWRKYRTINLSFDGQVVCQRR